MPSVNRPAVCVVSVKVRPSASALEPRWTVRCDTDPSVAVVEPHLTSDRKTSRGCHTFNRLLWVFKYLVARARVSLIAMGRNACDVWWGLQSEAPA
jgi:hypothetical protein